MLRPKYKFRDINRRNTLKYYRVSPRTKYFFSFHNEWLDSRLEYLWDFFYAHFDYSWSLVYTKRRAVRYPDEKEFIFTIDLPYSEDPFDNSKVFVDSVPFDDDEFGEHHYEPEENYLNEDFEFDDFFLENLFLFGLFIFLFLPVFFSFYYFVLCFILAIVLEEVHIFEDNDVENEDWEFIDDEEDDESFDEDFMFSYDDEGDEEFGNSTDFYGYAEFVFLDFFTFDEFFVFGRSWAHKPFYMKFLKIFKFN